MSYHVYIYVEITKYITTSTYQQHFGEISLLDRATLVEPIYARRFQDQYNNFFRDLRENWENCYDFARFHDDAGNNASSLDSVVTMTNIFLQPYARMPFYYWGMCSSLTLWSPRLAGSKNSTRNSTINNSTNKNFELAIFSENYAKMYLRQ